MTSDTGKFKNIGTALKTKLEELTYSDNNKKVFKNIKTEKYTFQFVYKQ